MSASLDRLALRVLLSAFPGTTLPADVAGLLADGLGGLCLFGSNTADGPAALRALTHTIRDAGPRAVIAIDEEGGDVTRVHARHGSPVLGAAALGAADDLALTRETGNAVGVELSGLGITMTLGPVADVNTNSANPVIGTRSFGSDPSLVAAHAAAWLIGLQEAGVAACAKHFPGHGDTDLDSHLAMPVVDVDAATLAARELVPFAAASDAAVAAVMTSHIVVPAIDPDLPATLSPKVLSVLREQLGFDGVIVTDALDMAGASGGRGIPEAAVLSLMAGADLLCLGAEKDVSLAREVQTAIVAAVRSGRLPEQRLAEAADHIAALEPHGPAARQQHRKGFGVAQLAGARSAVTVEGDLPRLGRAWVASVETDANIAVGERPWGLPADRAVVPGPGGLDGVPADRPLVIQVRDAHRHPEVGALLAEVADTGRPAVVVEWGWPGPYDGRLPRICTRGDSRPGRAAVTELLMETGWDR
jgi:beta-N-acetylhexosaminidase